MVYLRSAPYLPVDLLNHSTGRTASVKCEVDRSFIYSLLGES